MTGVQTCALPIIFELARAPLPGQTGQRTLARDCKGGSSPADDRCAFSQLNVINLSPGFSTVRSAKKHRVRQSYFDSGDVVGRSQADVVLPNLSRFVLTFKRVWTILWIAEIRQCLLSSVCTVNLSLPSTSHYTRSAEDRDFFCLRRSHGETRFWRARAPSEGYGDCDSC